MVTWRTKPGDVREVLLRLLNKVRPPIKFTVEQEEDGTLPLPQHATQEKRGWQSGCLCLQEAHTYGPISPLWVTHVKRGVVRCLHDRARGIISMQDNLLKEVDHLGRVLKQNCNLANFIHNASVPPHRNKQDRRRRKDHWWWYATWLGWVRTWSVFAGSSTSE